MPTLPFVTVDVFTSTRYAGNPLAIVLLPPEAATTVSTAQMQQVANEFNLSETVFLHAGGLSADSNTMQWRVRIFMVGRELPFAGHPTIGTVFYALGQQEGTRAGRLLCNAGPIEVSLDDVSDVADAAATSAAAAATPITYPLARAAIPHNVHMHTEQPFTVDEVLALQPGLADAGLTPADVTVVSPVHGLSFVTVRLRDLAALARVALSAKPRPRLDRGWDDGFASTYFYVETGEAAVRSRMIEGSFEDAATGSAACALAALLAVQRAPARGRTQPLQITQGVEMGRPSVIGVEITLAPGLDAVETIVLSGTAVKVMEGTVEY